MWMEPAGDGSAVRRTEKPTAIAGDEEVNGTGPETGAAVTPGRRQAVRILERPD